MTLIDQMKNLIESLQAEKRRLEKGLEWKADRDRLRKALELVLPLAKGYAAEHPVGCNQECIAEARAALEGKP